MAAAAAAAVAMGVVAVGVVAMGVGATTRVTGDDGLGVHGCVVRTVISRVAVVVIAADRPHLRLDGCGRGRSHSSS